MSEIKNHYLQILELFIDDQFPDYPESEERVYQLAGLKTNLKLVDEELTDLKTNKQVLDLIIEKNVDIKGLMESKNVEEYNWIYATYSRAIKCKNLGTSFCNKDYSISGKGWIGCNKTKLTEAEFDAIKRRCEKK